MNKIFIQIFKRVPDDEDDMEVASSDAKSKWDSKTQAIFKHRPLYSLRKKLKGVKRREDKEKIATITTTTTPIPPEVSPVTMPSVMPIVPFDSIYAAASQAAFVPPLFDPMAQYLPPPPSFIPRTSGPSMLAPAIASPLTGNPIYLVIQKSPSLTPHPYDALNALPSALIAHMAQLHYDMLQQNHHHSRGHYNNEESDPRETNHGAYSRTGGSEKIRSKSYFSNQREKENDLKQSDEMNSSIGQESNTNGNSNSISTSKYDRISDRSGQEKKDFSSFGFPGREIDNRDGDLHHSDYHSNGNSLSQDERNSVHGNLLPMTTAQPLTDHNGGGSPSHRNGGHPSDHHDHHGY